MMTNRKVMLQDRFSLHLCPILPLNKMRFRNNHVTKSLSYIFFLSAAGILTITRIVIFTMFLVVIKFHKIPIFKNCYHSERRMG